MMGTLIIQASHETAAAIIAEHGFEHIPARHIAEAIYGPGITDYEVDGVVTEAKTYPARPTPLPEFSEYDQRGFRGGVPNAALQRELDRRGLKASDILNWPAGHPHNWEHIGPGLWAPTPAGVRAMALLQSARASEGE